MSVRQTRLGLKLEGPSILKAREPWPGRSRFLWRVSGCRSRRQLWHRTFTTCFRRLDWEKTSLEAGQDWVVFAPNNPVSIAAAAIPQLAAAGNPGPGCRRSARESLGRRKSFVAGAVLAPSTGDSPAANTSPFFLQPTSGAASRSLFSKPHCIQ